ncbi:MAG: hypothetical protein PF795_06980 [Kiritimatiellae bacterium]|jgi:hypothetical protein|nr:hypothetical protein [Kiritimatiellia bacterium]
MQDKLLTEKNIGCAYKVYNTMGFGFLESVYAPRSGCFHRSLGQGRMTPPHATGTVTPIFAV